MKSILLCAILLISVPSIGQDYIYIGKKEVKDKPQYEGKSYVGIDYVRLVPSGNSGFTFKATPGNSFYVKIHKPVNNPVNPELNFVRTESIFTPVTIESNLSALPRAQKSTLFSYVDELGRNLQTVDVESSPTFKDVVSGLVYDSYGRQPRGFLDYTISNPKGAYRPNAVSLDNESYEAKAFYSGTKDVAVDPRPYNLKIFDDSPLNRINQQYGAGNDWQAAGKYSRSIVKIDISGTVLNFKYLDETTPPTATFFPSGVLTIAESTDEEGVVTREYRDFRGLTILSVRDATGLALKTYHVYDVAGNLRVVIPPEACNRLDAEYFAVGTTQKLDFLNRWAFHYIYDDYGRIIKKRTPDLTGWTTMVYDKWDRLVLLREPSWPANQWSFTKYDRFNRSIMKGFYYTSTLHDQLQTAAMNSNVRFENISAGATGYTLNNSYPGGITESNLLSVTYYDNYSFLSYSGWENEGNSFAYVSEQGLPATNFSTVKGYVTGSKIKNLKSGTWLNSVTYYDNRYRIIQTTTENHLSGKDRGSSYYDDLTTTPKKRYTTHSSSYDNVTVLETYGYDHAQRLKTITHQINNGTPILMVSNEYNELGQLVEKNIHSTNGGASFLQSVDMRYNIRGMLKSINNSDLSNDGTLNNDATDLFGMEIQYNQPSETISDDVSTTFQTVPLFNGNISSIKWKSNTLTTNAAKKIYGFKYDKLNRFLESHYAEDFNGAWTANPGLFTETVSRYDANGNIGGETGGTNTSALSRTGLINGTKTSFDNLTYRYNGNRLMNITDVTGSTAGFSDIPGIPLSFDEFVYDANGNLKEDPNKSITSITYNQLNLPDEIQITRPSRVDRVKYVYDADGNKLTTEVWLGLDKAWQTDYVGGIQYDNSLLSFASTQEGRVLKNATGWDYEYFYKDHQGNVRLTYGQLKETVSYKATMENPTSAYSNKEETDFRNVATTRDATTNYTKSSTEVLVPNKSSITNAHALVGKPVGPAKKLTMATGDKVKVDVFGRYTVQPGSTATILMNTLISAIATTTFGFNPGEAGYTSFNTNVPVISSGSSGSVTLPKAYLAYLFFDADNNFVAGNSGATSLSINAYTAFEKLTLSFTAPQTGSLYVYVVNETNVSATAGNVFWDDMLIVHQKNNTALQVTQASDYYPFGLPFNTYQSLRINDNHSNVQNNRYGFQGQEWQSDHDLNWSQFKYRMHDPAIGRFGAVDPLSDKYLYNSTYAFSENRLMDGVELEGLEFWGPSAMHSYFIGQNSYNWDGGYLTGTYDFSRYMLSGMYNSWKNSALGYFTGGLKLANENYEYETQQGIYRPGLINSERTKSLMHTAEVASNLTEIGNGWNTIAGTTFTAASFPLAGLEASLGASLLQSPLKFTPKISLNTETLAARTVNSPASLAIDGANLSKHLGQLQKYGQAGFKELQNGRFRYYGNLKPATSAGEMQGARFVREWNPATGNTRNWYETLDFAGRIRQVHPKYNNLPHFRFDVNGKFIGTW